jgi:AmiR/NasT family two-component response regulator
VESLIRAAQRVVVEQAGCTMDEALVLLRDTAEASDESIEAIAELVLSGEVRFD